MEDKKIGISIVIPTFNEEQRIIQSLELLKSYLNSNNYDWEIIVSDNGSKDKTVQLVEDHIKRNTRISILKSEFPGKGPAVRAGILASKKDFVLFMDADMATPIKELERLFIWICEQDYDVSIASREGLGAFRKGEPYIRHLMGRVFNTAVQLLAVSGINDTQCGFKLFKKEAGREIFGKLIVYRDFNEKSRPYLGAFDVEALVIANILGYKIKEVPVSWTYVPTKRISHIRDSIKMLRDVIRIRLNVVKGNY
ncbi:glycosyl transferase [candidate division WWE3 bacterium CG08_land_8_20_14_0_20_40_13]|uniref:dolichyl-phosphate beta-glucosyltransferase n=1 Tax=candidate division WWE3 bacterium CG08_land_8_20_14_0_20_40_13 TaxID=1975084 RepID=A0A2H0XG55_UNCKA|nr:MAG: glycosyl transferase [candidate division WWE3 bacterium CG08_land_8_20_14_0_20_40_13]